MLVSYIWLYVSLFICVYIGTLGFIDLCITQYVSCISLITRIHVSQSSCILCMYTFQPWSLYLVYALLVFVSHIVSFTYLHLYFLISMYLCIVHVRVLHVSQCVYVVVIVAIPPWCSCSTKHRLKGSFVVVMLWETKPIK